MRSWTPVTVGLGRSLACLGVCAAVALTACTRGESQLDPEHGGTPEQPARGGTPEHPAQEARPSRAPALQTPTPLPTPPREPYALPTATDQAWPSVPTGTTADGATWQTIRHETIHVHLAVPPDYTVERSTLPSGHPVVRLHGPGAVLALTYSSGAPHFAITGRLPPSLRDVRREASEQNVAMAYTDALGHRRVAGWTRAAQCELLHVTPANEARAFAICASLRHPHPGPLRPPVSEGPDAPWPPQPEGATAQTHGAVRRMLTGHFSLQVNRRGPCPDADTLIERNGPSYFELRPFALPNGPAFEGRSLAHLDGERWTSAVTVWATRAGQCCSATISGEPLPTDEQLRYVAELCDALGQP